MKTRIARAAMSMVGAAFLVLGAARLASAHAGDNDPNHEHACIGNVSKVVRIVGVSGTCLASPPLVAETPAHWSIQGPPGAPGANGAPGINGIDGTSATFVGYFAGSQNGCPNGGAIFGVGSVNAYVCNGIDGAGGTRADGPCFDLTNRYVDCGNGTVTDTVTGLIWLKQWNCLQPVNWLAANQAAAALKDLDCGLTDKSSPGDWRLPTKDEWSATIARAVALGCVVGGSGGYPSLTDDAGTACYGTGVASSFAGVADMYYWSSTTDETKPTLAWFPSLYDGSVGVSNGVSNGLKGFALRPWPVRGGGR